MSYLNRLLAGGALSAVAGLALAAQPATVRLDYMHTGNALNESYAIEQVVIEPLPWPGDMSKTIDTTNRGVNKVEVADAKSGKLVESFACGTAAVVAPIGRVRGRERDFTIGDGGAGAVTQRLRAALVDIQQGRAPDQHKWLDRLF